MNPNTIRVWLQDGYAGSPHETAKTCERCGAECTRDRSDLGVGVLYGPWGCRQCDWSDDPRYDLENIVQTPDGHRDQWGGFTPIDPDAA